MREKAEMAWEAKKPQIAKKYQKAKISTTTKTEWKFEESTIMCSFFIKVPPPGASPLSHRRAHDEGVGVDPQGGPLPRGVYPPVRAMPKRGGQGFMGTRKSPIRRKASTPPLPTGGGAITIPPRPVAHSNWCVPPGPGVVKRRGGGKVLSEAGKAPEGGRGYPRPPTRIEVPQHLPSLPFVSVTPYPSFTTSQGVSGRLRVF